MDNEQKTPAVADAKKEAMTSDKKNCIKDFIAKVVCLLLGFVLWYYAASQDRTTYNKTFTALPVTIVNESGFAVLSGDDVTVDITVSGKRNLISGLTADDVRAYIDMSDITEAGKHTFPIHYELPNGVTLKEAGLDSITVYADNTTSLSVPIVVKVEKYILDADYELADTSAITTNVRYISVTGPESVLQEIDHAYLGADIGRVTRTVQYSGSFVLRNKSGEVITNSYITTNVSTVTATIPVLKTREVPFTVLFRYGFLNAGNCDIHVSPATIRVRGEADEVDSLTFSEIVDDKSISGETTLTFGLSVPSTIQNLSNQQKVTVTLTPKGMATRTVSIFNITVKNPNNLSYEPLTVPLEVQLYGEASLISRISTVSISAVVDLSGQSGNAGTMNLPVTIQFSGTYEGKVHELGTYTIPIKILG